MTNEIAAKGIIAACQTLTGLLLMACTGRRDILFGVRLADGFRASEPGRRAVTGFRTIVIFQLLLSLAAILFASSSQLLLVLCLAPVTSVIAGILGFAIEHRRLKPFSVRPGQTREVELSSEPERLPWFMWLWPGPFVALAAAAEYLRSNWNRIPETFPSHWGIDGKADGWSHRTFTGVYGALILGAELAFLLCLLALAGWFGSRRSPLRPPMAALAIAVAYSLAYITIGAALTPLATVPVLVMLLGPLAFLTPAVIYLIRQSKLTGSRPDPTPDECWKGGVLYYNPNDAALMVERRDSIGLTVNFGNPWSWALLGLLVLNVATVVLLTRL